jgi:hypothetical protein
LLHCVKGCIYTSHLTSWNRSFVGRIGGPAADHVSDVARKPCDLCRVILRNAGQADDNSERGNLLLTINQRFLCSLKFSRDRSSTTTTKSSMSMAAQDCQVSLCYDTSDQGPEVSTNTSLSPKYLAVDAENTKVSDGSFEAGCRARMTCLKRVLQSALVSSFVWSFRYSRSDLLFHPTTRAALRA